MTRVAAIIFHPPVAPDSGPLTQAFATIRLQNAARHRIGFLHAGAEARIIEDIDGGTSFGRRVRDIVAAGDPDGLVLLGSGSIPLATAADRRAFVETAAGPPGHVLANNRYSADVVAIAGTGALTRLPDLAADNGLPRWLAEEAGFSVDDLRGRWRLQVDLDSPLDALLVRPTATGAELARRGMASDAVRAALAATRAISRDARCELIVAGRSSAAGLAWLERATASRTRAWIEERGFRTGPSSQRPVRSALGLLLDRDGPDALGSLLAEVGDAALVDSRVLLAHHHGADERAWPIAEDRFASDLLLPERIADPWLRALTRAALEAPIPIVLGGHSLVGPGLRLALGGGRAWT
jgi:hypothetical protein